MQYTPMWGNAYLGPQQYYQPFQLPQQVQQQQGNIVKVNGRDSALQYPTAPNTQSPPLFDMNGKVFYVVTADGAGSKTVETFDYSPHQEPEQQQPANLYVTRSEYSDLLAEVQRLREEVGNGLHGPVQTGSSTTAEVGTTGSNGGVGSQV